MKSNENCNRDFRSNPCLFAGILLNLVYQVVRCAELDILQSGWPLYLLCLMEGLALGLMTMGLLMLSPKRAEAVRNWKKAHLPFLVRN